MTFCDETITVLRRAIRWLLGLALAALGAYIIVMKIAVWPGIGVLAFGMFILQPDQLKAFAIWLKENAAAFLAKPGGTS